MAFLTIQNGRRTAIFQDNQPKNYRLPTVSIRYILTDFDENWPKNEVCRAVTDRQTDRRTDGQTDGLITVYPRLRLAGYNYEGAIVREPGGVRLAGKLTNFLIHHRVQSSP